MTVQKAGAGSRLSSRVAAGMALGAMGLLLAGCFGGGALDELDGVTPTGSAFSQALYNDYSYLANSFGDLPDIEDPDGWIPFFDTIENPLRPIAEAFANKALLAGGGNEPAPEPATDATSQNARNRLVSLLQQTKDQFPADAARTQAHYDCWILNGYVQSQAAASQACHRAFDNAMLRLANDLRPAPPPVATPVASQQSAGPVNDYMVYFDFDSWTLTPQALNTITEAVNAARAGGQSRITIVGHTDTSGSVQYNQGLSVRRANVVEETMVQMGARREAISVSGVGESDLEVPTGDGVRELRNRRAVINLLP